MRKNFGIISIVLSSLGLFWTFNRITSLAGQFCSWAPPFNEYEMITIIVGTIFAMVLIVGIILLINK